MNSLASLGAKPRNHGCEPAPAGELRKVVDAAEKLYQGGCEYLVVWKQGRTLKVKALTTTDKIP